MERLTRWLFPVIFAEETVIAVIAFDLDLFGQLPQVSAGNTLEEGHTLQYGLDRAGIIQLLEEAAHGWHNLHHTLHDLLRHFQHYGGSLCAGSRVALLARQHAMFAHVLTTAQNGNGQVLPIWSCRGEFKAAFQDNIEVAPKFAFAHEDRSRHKRQQLRGSNKMQ